MCTKTTLLPQDTTERLQNTDEKQNLETVQSSDLHHNVERHARAVSQRHNKGKCKQKEINIWTNRQTNKFRTSRQAKTLPTSDQWLQNTQAIVFLSILFAHICIIAASETEQDSHQEVALGH